MVAECVRNSEARRNSKAESQRWREQYVMTLKIGEKNLPKLSNNIVGPCSAKSIDDTKWKRPYAGNPELEAREHAAQKEVDLKRKQVAPAYNKGPTMLITDKRDWKTAGRKV